MRKGYKVTLGVLTIMILMTIAVGTSYSFFSVTGKQTTANSLATTCFNITFSDSNVIQMNTAGKYAYPMSETTALSKVTPYKFTITNTCTSSNSASGINYDITLNTLNSPASTLAASKLKYKLNVTAPTATTGTTSALNTYTYSLNSDIKDEHDVNTSYRLESGTLAAGATKTYNLYLWIDEAATNDVMNQTFTGKLLIYAYM